MKESMSSPSSRWMPSWRRAAKVKLGSLPLLPGTLLPARGENTESLVLVLRLLMEVLSSVSLVPVCYDTKINFIKNTNEIKKNAAVT